jgi:hypothetical protein
LDGRICDERLTDLATEHLRQTWSQLALFRGGDVLESQHAVGTPPVTKPKPLTAASSAGRSNRARSRGWETRAARYLLTTDYRYKELLVATLGGPGLTIDGAPKGLCLV